MKRFVLVITLLAFLLLVACSSHVHIIGNGPQTHEQIQARQWYILYGLVPLNNVDTNQMAAGATDYEIKTEQSAMDIILNMFTSVVSVYSRTVTVTK